MTRSWNSSAQTALAGDNGTARLLLFVEMDFGADGFVRWCTSRDDVIWNTHLWKGLGLLVRIGDVEESTRVEAPGLAFTLTATDAQLLGLAYNSDYQGRAVRLYAAPMTRNSTGYVFTDVRQVYLGYMDDMEVDDAAGTITLNTENALARLHRPMGGRMNDVDQQGSYPGDRGLEYVAGLESDTVIRWGQA